MLLITRSCCFILCGCVRRQVSIHCINAPYRAWNKQLNTPPKYYTMLPREAKDHTPRRSSPCTWKQRNPHPSPLGCSSIEHKLGTVQASIVVVLPAVALFLPAVVLPHRSHYKDGSRLVFLCLIILLSTLEALAPFVLIDYKLVMRTDLPTGYYSERY